MGMGTAEITRVPWDSHGYGNDAECTMGLGIGMGIKAWEWE